MSQLKKGKFHQKKPCNIHILPEYDTVTPTFCQNNNPAKYFLE